jgi:hypothetical protein
MAPNIVSAMPLALDEATTATNIAPAMPLASDVVTAVDLSPHNVDDDGFFMALSATGMPTASPRGAVMVVGTPARSHNTYDHLRGSDQLVSSGETRIEDSQPLYTPPEDTAPPLSPPLSLQQWGRGNDFRRLQEDCNALLNSMRALTESMRELATQSSAQLVMTKTDRVAIKDLVADNRSNFATLFANHSQAMAKLFDAMEAKEAKLFDAMEAKEAKLFAAMEAKDVACQSQIQASFNKFHNLEKQFRSIPNAITAHLDTAIPQVMALVVDRTLPTMVAAVLRDTISPTLKTMMDNTITDSLLLVLEGSFTDFAAKFSLIGMDMA